MDTGILNLALLNADPKTKQKNKKISTKETKTKGTLPEIYQTPAPGKLLISLRKCCRDEAEMHPLICRSGDPDVRRIFSFPRRSPSSNDRTPRHWHHHYWVFSLMISWRRYSLCSSSYSPVWKTPESRSICCLSWAPTPARESKCGERRLANMVCWERDLGSRQGSRRRWRDVWFLLRSHLNGLFGSSLELHKVEHKPNNTLDCCPCLIMDRAKLSALSLSVWFLCESLSHCLVELVLLVLVWKKAESYGGWTNDEVLYIGIIIRVRTKDSALYQGLVWKWPKCPGPAFSNLAQLLPWVN